MKYVSIILIIFLVCSCSSNPNYTGQRFVEGAPTFYMSLAPTFERPYEYEVNDGMLVLREYSGLDGYNWGGKKLVATSAISREEYQQVRALVLEAIADTIEIEEKRKESGEVVIMSDGVRWYIQSDLGPFFSISTNNPESKAFSEILALLNSILDLSEDEV